MRLFRAYVILRQEKLRVDERKTGELRADDVVRSWIGKLIGFWIVMWLKKAVRSIDET